MAIDKKRNKVLLFLVLILMLICVVYIAVNSPRISRYFVFDENIELKTYNDNDFYVNVADEAGNIQKISIDFKGEANKYVGSLYIPGSYEGPLYLCWEEDVKVNGFLSKYETNQMRVRGKWISFYINLNGKRTDFLLIVNKTSENVEPLFINIDESLGSINDMNSDYNHEISCFGQAYFNNEVHYISIKGRGNSTWRFGLKKPYNITFTDSDYSKKQSVSMIENVKSKKWSLLANYDDPTLLRNKIGYELANDMSIGLNSKYFDVWMNGNYLGNYLITPKNDYLATEEGFILELDNNIDNEDPQFLLKNNSGEIKSLLFTVKDNSAGLEIEEIEEYMQSAWNALENYDSKDYLNYFDIDSWAKMYLLNELFKNYDVVNGSILMHRDGKSKDNKLVAGPIWDLDNALGTLMPNETNGLDNNLMFSGEGWYISSISLENNNYCLLQELGKHDDFIKKVKDLYKEYEGRLKELISDINNSYFLYHQSFDADYYKWGNNRTINNYYNENDWNYAGSKYAINYNSTNTYDEYLNNLILYVSSRIMFLEENIDIIK